MRIESLWRDLENEADGTNAWLTRYALPEPSQPLLVAFESVTKRRALLLPLPKVAIPTKREWPKCRGLEVICVALSGQAYLGVRLLDPACSDVFAALAEDLAPRVAAASNAREAAKVMLSRLLRWQKFLAAGTTGLSTERQKGLYGELHTLREHLLPRFGASLSVKGWRAPLAAHQDFQFSSGAIEVKTTTAKQPQAIRITSERQLDDTGVPVLFLHVVVLDEREVESGTKTGVDSLPGLVGDLRLRLAPEAKAADLFDDRLLDVGYLDVDVPRYESRLFTLRREHSFQVQKGFPRLVERGLPTGVGDVSYDLSLAVCEPFAVEAADMLNALTVPVVHRPRRTKS